MTHIDDILKNQVNLAISGNPYLTRQNLRFEMREGRVTLRGVVNSYFQKQMAQEAIRHLDGVREIENQLEVNWS